jgi:hypothetical protein
MSDPPWQETLTPVLRTLQIIVGALLAGCTFFLAIVLIASREMAGGDGPPLLSYTAIACGVMALLARAVTARAIVAAGRRNILRKAGRAPIGGTWSMPQPVGVRGDTLDESAVVAGLLPLLSTATIAACAMLEGATFFLLVAYLVEQWLPALIVAVAMIVLLALHLPTRSRVIHWVEDQLALLGQERQLGNGSGETGRFGPA